MSGVFNLATNANITVSNSGYCLAQGSGGTTNISSMYLGTVFTSLLTESQMNTIDSNVFLCDGRSCVGTSYELLTSNSTVPDMRGQFLRGLDPTGIIDPDGAGRTLGDSQQDEFESHTHPYTDNSSSNVNHIAGGPSASARNVTTVNRTTSATGGAETRPKNISINFYLKVN